MALTRKFLSAIGIEGDNIDEIITAHTDTVNALKEERDRYKTDAEQYKADSEKLADVEKELTEAREKLESDDTTAKLESLEKEYKEYKQSVEAKETKQAKENAYKKILKDAGVDEKRISSILRVSDIDSVEIQKDGTIKDADKLTESIKTEWSDFIVTSNQEGSQTPTPPQPQGAPQPQGTGRAKQLVQQYNANKYGTKLEG